MNEARQPDLIPAVLRDVRETLRMRWIDSSLEAAASHPVFFTAAWSALRPNIGPGFVTASRRIRDLAAEGVEQYATAPDHREWARLAKLEAHDLDQITVTTRAFHESMAKVAIAVHALARAARGRSAGGSGIEEPPPKRGVPGWHPRVVLEPNEDAQQVLADAIRRIGAPEPPDLLVALSAWPGYVTRAWREAKRFVGTDGWNDTTGRVRRATIEAVRRLPHLISLQWSALKERGFSDEERRDVGDALAGYDAAMPGTVTLVAYLWLAAGAPSEARET